MTLNPDRTCGACNACCWALKIDDPELQKVPVAVCPNWKAEQRCLIYEDRPHTCRTFHCGWRAMPLGDEWRPDLCGILIVTASQTLPLRAEDGVQFELIGGPDKIHWPPFLELVADFMTADVPVYLAVPRGVGFYSTRAHLSGNEVLKRLLLQKEFSVAALLLSQAVQACLAHPKTKAEFGTPKQDVVVNQ